MARKSFVGYLWAIYDVCMCYVKTLHCFFVRLVEFLVLLLLPLQVSKFGMYGRMEFCLWCIEFLCNLFL